MKIRLIASLVLCLNLLPLSGFAAASEAADSDEIAVVGESPADGDYLPGALIDRKTGNRLRSKCLDSGCTQTVLTVLDDQGMTLTQSKQALPRGEDVKLALEHMNVDDAFFPFTKFIIDDSGVPLALALLPVTAVVVALDVTLLPYGAVTRIDWEITRAKIRKFENKKVRITHSRFESVLANFGLYIHN